MYGKRPAGPAPTAADDPPELRPPEEFESSVLRVGTPVSYPPLTSSPPCNHLLYERSRYIKVRGFLKRLRAKLNQVPPGSPPTSASFCAAASSIDAGDAGRPRYAPAHRRLWVPSHEPNSGRPRKRVRAKSSPMWTRC